MKIYLSGDHAGFILKEKIKKWLEQEGYVVVDCGPFKLDKKDDYPDYVVPMAKKVSKDKGSFGFSFAGSGEGEAIAMNKVKGIRAVVYYGKNLNIVKFSRKHNNANILSFGAWFAKEHECKRAISIFLKTEFDEGSRHERRLKKIEGRG